ncbi:MAG TPA: ABC transporter permease [Terriglobales bacterium]|nr:ABC transporter permease [Terriglobales bacterium]
MFSDLFIRFRSLFRRKSAETDLDSELRFHLDRQIEKYVVSGLSREDAHRLASLDLGGLEQTKEECRDARGVRFLESFFQDLQFGLRMLRKSPGFTAVAILTLALGIGATTAIFSYVDAWVIKPLPYPDAGNLMVLQAHDTKKGWTSDDISSAADFYDLQKQNKSFQQLAAWASWNFNLTGDGPPAFLEGGRVSWNYFETLGAKPLMGRIFTPDDDRPGAAHVVILSQGLWRTRYAADPSILGRTIRIDDEPYSVVGVMPANFQLPLMGIANLWTPLALTEKERADRNASWFAAFGRLEPGVTPQQAASDCAAFFSRLEKQYPQTNTNVTVLVNSMTEEVGRHEGTTQVMICFWIVGLILLIACANVANLMLARATARAKEFALRRALGAAGGRLARQLVSESLLLFFFGAISGTLFGAWGMRWIQSAIPDHVRGYLVNFGRVDLNFNVLAFTLGIALFCGLVFGLVPAYESSRLDLNKPLKESSGQLSGSGHGARLRRIFVAAEIALAVVVLIASTLLVRSFVISVRSSPGFNPENVTIAQLELPNTRYAQETTLRNFTDAVLARIRALPQVSSAAAASAVPFGGFGRTVDIQAVGKPAPPPGEQLGARFTAVTPDYFSTMRIQLLKGRTFTSADAPGTVPAAVINETLAKQLWPSEDPIGQKIQFGEQHAVCTIVGIVRGVKMYYLRAEPERQMYVSYSQFPSSTLGIAVRAVGSSPALPNAVRDAVWSVDPDQPVSSVEQLDTLISISDSGNSVLTKLMVFFGLLAMLLGAIGIYGLMSQLVSQRVQEIGIRMALGASPLQVLRMVIGQGLRLALIGIAIGVLAALAVTRSLAAVLYGVSPSDAATFIGVAILFAAVAVAAGYLPARRAMRVDPIVALRYE